MIYWFFFGLLIVDSVYWLTKPVGHDVAILLYGANRMLEGAKLYVDVIEVNPPLIYYITALPTWIANLFGLSHVVTFKYFVATLALVSVSLGERLTRSTVPLVPNSVRNIFLFALPFVFFIYIHRNFGQREHLMFMLVMPYILATIGRAEGRSIGGTFAVLLGTLAGLGLAIKPFFLLLWVSIESYLQLAYPNRVNWRRPENVGIAVVIATYGILALLLSHEYLGISAMAIQVYSAYNSSFADLLTYPAIGLWVMGLFTFGAARFNLENKVAKEVLLLASTAFLLIVIIQHKGWSYHYYPAEAAALLLLTITVPQLLKFLFRFTKDNFHVIGLMRVAVVATAVAIVGINLYKPLIAPTYRMVYWSVEAAVNVAHGKALPYEAVSTILQNSFEDGLRPPLKELISVVEEHADRKPILLLSSSVFPAFPLVTYSTASWTSRFGCLWLLPGSYQNPSNSKRGPIYHDPNQMDDVERFLFQTVISDMISNPPVLLIVDSSPYKQGFRGNKFDYIDYFSQDARFATLLTTYEPLTKVSTYAIFKRRDS